MTQISEKAILQYEVEQFLYEEAALLDNKEFVKWMELIADDIHYWMPIRRTVTNKERNMEFTKIGDNSFFDEDKEYLAMRAKKLDHTLSWSENPGSRTRHNVSNVRIVEVDGNEIEVELNFHLYRSRLNDAENNWYGRRRDRVRRVGNGFQLVKRHIFLDHTIIHSSNLSVIF